MGEFLKYAQDELYLKSALGLFLENFSNFIYVTYCDLACFRHLWLVLDGIRLFMGGCRCF